MTSREIISTLKPFVSDHKQSLIEKVLNKRTRHITLVFEDIDKPQNISAVLRTAECMGIQDVHFIKNQNDYRVSQNITQGAAKWLTLHHHNNEVGSNNVDSAFSNLRRDGYRIYATSLGSKVKSVNEIDTTHKTAIVFGTEISGISKEVEEKVDGLVQIPMNGFTESFNLSVSASIILTVLLNNRSDSWNLNEDEKLSIKGNWFKNIVRESDMILERSKQTL